MKTCFKCGNMLPLTEFYRQKGMADGHLGKCKECTKADVHANYHNRIEQYHAYDLRRSQDPERRKSWPKFQRNRRALSPEKYKAHNAVTNAMRDGKLVRQPCQICGSTNRVEAHHHDYSKPLEVQWLCFKCHREIAHGQKVTAF